MAKLVKVGRLPFLVAGLVLFLLGALVGANAGGHLAAGPLILGYATVAAARLSVHFSNDYFDAITDVPSAGSLIGGGSGVLSKHPELRTPVKRIAIMLIGISMAAGVGFVILYSLPLWVIGLLLFGNLMGWFYSAPPLRFSERGWGEVCYVFAAGFLEPAVGYMAARHALDTKGLYFLAPLMMYALVSILNAEIPDLEADHAGGKHNWIERCGRGFGFGVSGALLLAAALYFFLIPFFFPGAAVDGRVLGLLSLIPALTGLAGLLFRTAGRRAATRLATATVVALVVFGLLTDAYLFLITSHIALWPARQ